MDLKYKLGSIHYKIKDGIEDYFFNLKDGKKGTVIGTVLSCLVVVAVTVVVVFTLVNNKPVVAPETDPADESSTTKRGAGVYTPTQSKGDEEDFTGNKISWEPVEGAKSYMVYRSDKQGGDYEFVTETTETSYIDKDVEEGVRYFYKATAVKESAEDKTTTTTAPTTTTTTAPSTTTTTQKPTTTTTTQKPTTTTTTQKPTTTTTVPPSNAGKQSGSEDINAALNAFNANAAASGMTAKQLAALCGAAIGNKGRETPVSVTSIRGTTKQPVGFAECWQFTADFTISTGACMGYVFKVSDGISSADFAGQLTPAARAAFTKSGLTEMPVKYSAVAYYGPYVFFMIAR